MVRGHIIEKAQVVAGNGNVAKARVSAIAFSKSGKIIACAHNRRICFDHSKLSQHAEEVLIYKLHRLKAFARFKDIRILVLRITSNGLAIAKPCNKCQQLLAKYDVKVFYTNQYGTIEAFYD